MLGKVNGRFVVRFNNHGEVLSHYTVAPSEAKAKTNAAYAFAKLLGVSLRTVTVRMRGHSDVIQVYGGTK
jgi:hypothetical protein